MASGAAQVLHHPRLHFILSPTLTCRKKYPWRAAAETVGMNVGVWAFDRYVMKRRFCENQYQQYPS